MTWQKLLTIVLVASAWVALALAVGLRGFVSSPLIWSLLTGMLALILLLPRGRAAVRILGAVIGVVSLGLLGGAMLPLGQWLAQGIFYVLAAVTVVSAVAMISMRSAVYAAIWFALSLVGTAGLFMLQGAQFLSIATIVVYAGAIVVTFLFVIMLAQPEGEETYDRLSWSRLAKWVSVPTAALLVALLAVTLSGLRDASATTLDPNGQAAAQRDDDLLHPQHMAHLGRVLFSQHLVSIEVAGTLLLVALVGAVAITIQGRPEEAESARTTAGTGGHE